MGRITQSAGATLLAFASLAAGGLVASAAAQTGSLRGRIVTTAGNRPVAAALIFVDGASSGVRSDSLGRFLLASVPAGNRSIEARRIGFRPARVTARLESGVTIDVELAMEAVAQSIATLTVIGTPSDLAESKAAIEAIPGGVDYIGPAQVRGTRQANLPDLLGLTPGVFAQSRFGAADESQISIRGSGLRNNFHARGLNVLVNGMPYRNADGFTDFESLELATVEAVEVVKGANAFRLGGSTLGGAINLVTKTGYTSPTLGVLAQGGSFGFFKGQIESGHQFGPFDYYASYARTSVDGYRQWSDQGRDRVNLHLGYRLGDRTDVRMFYFGARVREELPGALTAAEFAADPTAALAENVSNRWGRAYDLHHVGLQLRTQLGPNRRLEVSPYLQYRDIDHPIFEVINQQSYDVGAEVRYLDDGRVFGRPSRLTVGFQPAIMRMHNRQFVNVAGAHGDLTRDERDRVGNLALYAEESLDLGGGLVATAGLRYDRSRRTVKDAFLANGDQSDSKLYEPVTPRFGLMYHAGRGVQLFANVSKTVEPPLLLEMTSYGNAGGFLDLAPQRAWQMEVGTRGAAGGFAWELSLYDIELEDEILNLNVQPFPNAPFTVPTYRNSPKTRHQGVEVGLDYTVPGRLFANGASPDRLAIRTAYTYGRFRYVDDPAYEGKAIPGAPAHHFVGELRYDHPAGLRIVPRIEWVPEGYFLDSPNTVRNESWATLGVRAEWMFTRLGVTAFVEGRNLTDRKYSGSVQVDSDAGQYYEPADRRSVLIGMRWAR